LFHAWFVRDIVFSGTHREGCSPDWKPLLPPPSPDLSSSPARPSFVSRAPLSFFFQTSFTRVVDFSVVAIFFSLFTFPLATSRLFFVPENGIWLKGFFFPPPIRLRPPYGYSDLGFPLSPRLISIVFLCTGTVPSPTFLPLNSSAFGPVTSDFPRKRPFLKIGCSRIR